MRLREALRIWVKTMEVATVIGAGAYGGYQIYEQRLQSAEQASRIKVLESKLRQQDHLNFLLIRNVCNDQVALGETPPTINCDALAKAVLNTISQEDPPQ